MIPHVSTLADQPIVEKIVTMFPRTAKVLGTQKFTYKRMGKSKTLKDMKFYLFISFLTSSLSTSKDTTPIMSFIRMMMKMALSISKGKTKTCTNAVIVLVC